MRYLTTFTGVGGYENEQKAALKVFKVGQEYEVVGGRMGGSHTSIRLKGIEGNWNSTLFDVDIWIPIIERPYLGMKNNKDF